MLEQFDNQFNALIGEKDKITLTNPLRWLPWVGDSYEEKRVLFIGHSHYADDDPKEFTRDVINKFLENPLENPNKGHWTWFFVRASQIMGYESVKDADEDTQAIRNLWENCAFMQFFQGASESKYAESITACQAVYRILAARKVIVFYKDGEKMLNNTHGNEKLIPAANRLYITHPSWITDGAILEARKSIAAFMER